MAKIEWVNAPTEQERRAALVARLSVLRKNVEKEGVVVDGARFAGDAENRQALNEALQLAQRQSMTVFNTWKDSDNKYFSDFAVSSVDDALVQIGLKRGALISKEAQFAAQIMDGSLEDITNLDWSVSLPV